MKVPTVPSQLTTFSLQVLLSFTLCIFLNAKEIRVRQNADSENINDGLSWENATNLLRAISMAQPGDEIWISEGVYHPSATSSLADIVATFELKGGVALLGGFAGHEATKEQRDHRANPTILSGDLGGDDLLSETLGYQARSFNCLNVCQVTAATTLAVTLDGLTITNAAPNTQHGTNPGAGILCKGGKLYLRNCSFIANQSNAPKGGGAISLTDNADAVIENCVFRANFCTGDGGAIYALDSNLSLSQCEFSGNYTQDDGGAIYFRSGNMTMDHCTIVGNRSQSGGGGILLFNATVTISNSVFWDNEERSTPNSPGGQIIAPGRDNSVQVDHSLIQNSGGSSSWQLGIRSITDLGDNIDLNPSFEKPISFPTGPQAFAPVSIGGNFRPRADSPLLDRASTDPPGELNDLNGQPRKFGVGTDIGAFEWNGEFTPPVSTITQVTTGEILRRSVSSLSDLIPFDPTAYRLVSNSNPDLANVTVDPVDGSLEITWNNETPTDAVDLLFEIVYHDFPIRFPMTLDFVPGVFYVDQNQDGPADGLSWQTALPSLQDALAALTPNLSQSIWVAQGSYFPDDGINQIKGSQTESFRLVSGSAIYGGFSGTETSLAQRDSTANPTILSGDLARNDAESQFTLQENSGNIVLIEDNTETSILDGFTVAGGYKNRDDGVNIRIWNAKALIQNMRLGRSKGIPVYVGLSPQTCFTNCDFKDLAIDNVALDIGSSVFTLKSSRVQGTKPNQFAQSGGFLRSSSSILVIESTLFTGNRLAFSPISISHGFNDASLLIPSPTTIRHCTFSGNIIQSTNFGANPDQVVPLIRNNGAAHLTIENSIFWDNSWKGDYLRDDSLISNFSGATSSFENCIVENGFIDGIWSDKLGDNRGGNSLANPLFINPILSKDAPSTQGNFSLASGSPAIDQGPSEVPLTTSDALGGNRIIGASSDLGAIEWEGSIQAPPIQSFLFTGPHGFGTSQVSLRDSLGALPASFAIVANDATEALTATVDTSSGIIDIELTNPLWTGSATIQYSATIDDDTFTGIVEIIVIPKVIHVRNTATEGRQDGLDWSNAFSSLKNALAIAVKNSGQEIWISEGIYRSDDGTGEVPRSRMSPFLFPSGVSLYGGFSGNETALDRRDPSINHTIISSPAEPPGSRDEPKTDHNFLAILEIGATSDTLLDGLIFQGEFKNATHGTHGKILSCEASRATISNCRFIEASLGGIFASYSFDTITQCYFENIYGIISIASNHLINSTDFTDSTISFTKSSGQILNCNFSAEPSRQLGPAIGATGDFGADLSIKDCRISGYQKAAAIGGGLSPLILERCHFTGNFSAGNGGAVSIGGLAHLSILNCIFEGNTSALEGGALSINNNSLATQESLIEGCLFAGNKAEANGGAFRIGSYGQGGGLVRNCTITDNSAGSTGGAVSPNGGIITYEGCIITGNTSSEGYQIYPVPFTASRAKIKNSIVEGTGGSSAWSETGLRDLGGNLDVLPLFKAPNSEPAPSVGGDYRLRFNSPAIDQAFQRGGLTSDLDGSPRLSGAFVDLGAYEFQFSTTPSPSFTTEFPTLAPNEDENQNRTSNFTEFAFGGDPTSPGTRAFSHLEKNQTLRFNIRQDPQIKFSYQYSTNLVDWLPLQEANDFEFGTDQIDGIQVQKTLVLTEGFLGRNPQTFFRHRPVAVNPN